MRWTLVTMIFLLVGCQDSLDAQDYEHNRDYDRYSIAIDSGSVIVRGDNGRGQTRGVAQYQGSLPTVRVEVVDRVLEIEGTCGERTTTCLIDFFVDVQAASEGTIDVGSGTVQIEGLSGDHTIDVTDGTLVGDDLGMNLLIGEASGDVTLEWMGFPRDVSLESGAGDIDLRVPTGDYALDLSAGGEVTNEGVTHDAASDKSIRAVAAVGDVAVTGT